MKSSGTSGLNSRGLGTASRRRDSQNTSQDHNKHTLSHSANDEEDESGMEDTLPRTADIGITCDIIRANSRSLNMSRKSSHAKMSKKTTVFSNKKGIETAKNTMRKSQDADGSDYGKRSDSAPKG